MKKIKILTSTIVFLLISCNQKTNQFDMKNINKALHIINKKNDVIKIDYLANHQEWIKPIAQWTLDAWGQYDPSLTMERSIASIKSRLNTDKIPLTFVVDVNNLPVATANLKEAVLVPNVPKDKVWLGSFYVKNEYRNKGIGSMLMQAVYKKAIELGKNELFLFSSDHSVIPWYLKQNWVVTNELPFQGHTVVIMRWEA